MYRPSYSVSDRQELALELIRQYPLGLLISHVNGKVEINHLPFLLEQENNEIFLLGHFAKANPHWRLLGNEVVVSFQGPNAYISPTVYVDKVNVPTWNYAAVQVHGAVEVVSDKNSLKDILERTVRFFEHKNGTGWSYELPEKVQEELEMAIVGLKIKVTRIEAKFKMSQNRSAEDYSAVLDFFRNRKDLGDQELYNWMLKTRG